MQILCTPYAQLKVEMNISVNILVFKNFSSKFCFALKNSGCLLGMHENYLSSTVGNFLGWFGNKR
jgi:hypothetical protein